MSRYGTPIYLDTDNFVALQEEANNDGSSVTEVANRYLRYALSATADEYKVREQDSEDESEGNLEED